MAKKGPDTVFSRILVVKLRYVGDVLLATPVLSRLREGFPKAHLTMLVNPGTDGVVRGHPALDDVMVAERGNLSRQWRFVRELRRRRFDLVIDLTDSDRSAVLSRLSGAPVRLGYNSEGRWRGCLYSRIVEADRFGMHQVHYHLTATEALGLSGPPPPPVLMIAPEARSAADRLLKDAAVDASKPLVCLHPGARWWFKSWPSERFGALADLIHTETPAQALFLGGEQERDAAHTIAGAMKTPFRSLIGRTGLPELAAVLERASLMVSNDNGPMHMAAALRIPVVGLFGPSDPAVWGPWGEGHRTFYKGLDCRACFHPDCFRGEQNCMRLITLEEVWGAVGQGLSRREGG
jgi:predicted lipopolysaccharide heptosyltransferase III